MKGFKRHVAVFLSYISIFIVIFSNFGVEASAAEKTELEKVSGQIILKLKSVDDKSYEKIVKKYKGKIQDSQDSLILVSLDNEDIPKLVKEARNNSNIEYTEVNALGNKSGVPSDELLDAQYYLNQSNTISAWNSITDTAKKKEVKVAIIDSGIKTSHSEFKGEIISAKNIITGSTNVEDDNGHGTEIAGIIAAKHDGKGIAGIAGLLNIKLIPVKVLDKNGAGTTYNISKGIKYAADKGAQIINISINGKGYSKVINDAIKYAASKKALVIVSAPNIENYNNSGYAKGYWPCNSDGVLVASGERIKDINNSVVASNYGYTTNTGSEKYGQVEGNSYSSAVVTGAAALLKVTKPSDSISQLSNILVSSNNNYGSLDIEKALSTKSDFIEVVSPTSSNILSGDVQVKVAALNPANLKKISIYVNSTDNLVKTINSTGAKEYSFTIPSSKILESTNKLTIKAEDKAGKSYISETYFSYEIKDKGVIIEVKDQKGKNFGGALVELRNSYGASYGQAITDSSGVAKFQEAQLLSQLNNYENLVAVITNGDSDNNANNLYYVKNITKGKNTINLSTDGKEITISGKKNDGKYLTKGKIYLDKEYKYTPNSSGQTKVIVNKNRQLDIQLVSQEEGYLYSKFIPTANDITKVEFKVDSSVGKLDIKNALDSNIVNETLRLKSNKEQDTSEIFSFSIKNKPIYVAKGEYYYYYSICGKKSNESLEYTQGSLNISDNKTLSFGIPTINSKINSYNGYNSILINLTDSTNKQDIYLGDGNNISVSLVDSKNKAINKDKYSVKIIKYGGQIQSLEVVSNKIDINNTKAVIKVSILGKTLTSTVKLGGTTTSTKIAEISYKLPKDMDSLIKSDGNITSYLSYYVYDSKTKARVYSGNSYLIKKQGSFYIPTTYANNKYGISVIMNFADKNIFYNRTLGTPVNNKLYINSDKGEAKRLTLSGKELSKIVPNDSSLRISNGVVNLTANVNGKSTYTWIDKGSYDFNVYNNNSYILGKLQVNSSSANINFDKLSLGKFTVKAPIDNNKRTAFVTVDNGYGVQIPINKQIFMSTSQKVTNVQVNTKDRFGNLSNTMNFKGNVTLNSGTSKTLDLTNLNVTNKNIPSVIKPSGNLSFSSVIKSGEFTVDSMYGNYGQESNSLNFIKANGIIAAKARVLNNSGTDFSVNSYAVQPGDYTLKLDLFGVGTKDSGVKVKVSSTDQIAIKVMDPNNTSKPLANATVILGGQKKITDINGTVYFDKTSLYNLNQLKILIESENEVYLYAPASKSVSGNQAITINKGSLKKATIKSDGLNKDINFKNALVKIYQNSMYNSGGIDFKLNSSGQKTIYYNDAISKINIIGDNFILESSNPEKSKFVVKTNELGKLAILEPRTDMQIIYQGNYINAKSNIMFVTPGDIQYSIYKNGFYYFNNFSIKAKETKTVKIGTKFTAKVTNTNSGNNVPFNTLNSNIKLSDEYGNKLKGQVTVKANIYYNNSVKEKIDLGNMYSENEGINTSFNTSVVYSSIQYDFDVTINNVKYKTNKITVKYDLSKYQTVNVKDPLGKNIVSGELRNSKTGTINKVINGKSYIEKTSITSGAILSLKGVNSSGDIVVYNDYKVTSNTKEIKLTSAKKIAMNISLPKTASDYGNYCFFVKSLSGDGDEIYKENISDKAELVKKYSGKNIWINSGEYVVGVSYSKYNNVQEYYLLGKIVNKATTSVKIDGSSLTNIGLSYDNNKITINNTKYTVNGYDVLNLYGADSKVYVTPSLINGYRIGASKKDNYEYFSYRKDGLKVSGSSYKISLGNKISAKLEYNGKSIIPENNIIKSYITVSDEYKNIITGYNFFTTAIVSIGDCELEKNYYNTYSIGEKIESQVALSQKYPEIDLKYEVNFLGDKFTTNTLKYSGDTSSYEIIDVFDPNGQPLASGTLNKGWGTPYIIANGKAYINKTDNLESNKFTMVGNNKAGELVVYTNLSLNSSTKEIKDTTVKQVSMNINLPSKFDNNGYYEFVIKKLESNNYNEYSRYNLTKEYLIKNYSGKKMWISGGDHFIGIRYTKYSTGLDNEYYLMGSLVTKDTKNIKIDGSSLTNITLDYDKSKLDINNIEFTVNECSILSRWYDSNTKIYVTPSLIKGYNISAYDKMNYNSFSYKKQVSILGSRYNISLGNKFTAKVEDVNKGIIPESREIENNITIKDEYNNDVYTHDGIDVTSTIYVSGKETDKYWDYIYFGDGKLNKKIYLYREYSEFELTHEFNFLGNKFTTNTLKYSKI